MNADERIKKAMELRGSGYNCAQTVLMVFTDATGVDIDMSANIGAALGAGVATGEICGVANAMAVSEGLILSNPAPDGKLKAMPAARKLLQKFSDSCGGCITCHDLKGKCGKSCDELIAEGIRILDSSF